MKSDDKLGMNAQITRRDLIQDAGLATVAIALGGSTLGALADGTAAAAADSAMPGGEVYYPPTRTGLRGSHPGAFETAHALAREGKAFPTPRDLDEDYDLVIVGAGISGLAAAHYYRERFGEDTRILLLENHDDFGGHAKRNEFHQGGKMRLSLGGTHNLEWWEFSGTVKRFLKAHGVDVKAMRKKMAFSYGRQAPNSPAIWFDKAHFGVDRLVTRCNLSAPGGPPAATLDQLPLSEAAREELKAFYARRENQLKGKSRLEAERYLSSISYTDFLRRHGKLGDEAAQLFDKLPHGGWGVEMRALSAKEAFYSGYPGLHLVGEKPGDDWEYPVAMWPDGNASLARLQVASLIPDVAPGTNADNVAVATFDYAQLDRDDAPVRLRLNATVIHAENSDDGVAVSYVQGGEVLRLRARHCVMACYHVIIPHLCPELPAAQRSAMKYQVKHPLLLTNVLIRNMDALNKLGIDSIDCPGRMHSSLFTFRGINTGGYEHTMDDDGPVSLVFWGAISPPEGAEHVHDQLRASRALMLAKPFEEYEREVREVLDGLLGPAGFDVAEDILAITVNRWPHGYSYEYLDLWDDDYERGQAPHEIARETFGRIAFANADAGANAYTHTAIDEAFRAVKSLPDEITR